MDILVLTKYKAVQLLDVTSTVQLAGIKSTNDQYSQSSPREEIQLNNTKCTTD